VQKNAIAHAKRIDTLLAISLMIVNPFDPEWIIDGLDGVIESDPMATPVARGLLVVPFETPAHKNTEYP